MWRRCPTRALSTPRRSLDLEQTLIDIGLTKLSETAVRSRSATNQEKQRMISAHLEGQRELEKHFYLMLIPLLGNRVRRKCAVDMVENWESKESLKRDAMRRKDLSRWVKKLGRKSVASESDVSDFHEIQKKWEHHRKMSGKHLRKDVLKSWRKPGNDEDTYSLLERLMLNKFVEVGTCPRDQLPELVRYLNEADILLGKIFTNDWNIIVLSNILDAVSVVLDSQFAENDWQGTMISSEIFLRELELERKCMRVATENSAFVKSTLFGIGKVSQMSDLAKKSRQWLPIYANAYAEAIRETITRRQADNPGGYAYSPDLILFKSEDVMKYTLHFIFEQIPMHKGQMSIQDLSIKLGKFLIQMLTQNETSLTRFTEDLNYRMFLFTQDMEGNHRKDILNRALSVARMIYSMKPQQDEEEEFLEEENSIQLSQIAARIGANVLKVLCNTEVLDLTDQEAKELKESFPEQNPRVLVEHHQRRYGRGAAIRYDSRVRFTESARRIIEKSDIGTISDLAPSPMLVPPLEWKSIRHGPYLLLKTDFLRTKRTYYLNSVMQEANLSKIFESVNALSATPWVINKEIYKFMMECWDKKIKIGKIPSRSDIEMKPIDSSFSKEEMRAYKREQKLILQRNAEMYSLRCDFMLRMNVAKNLFNDEIYFPYNLDFRGRAYPIPPHLNHIGSDIARALLLVS